MNAIIWDDMIDLSKHLTLDAHHLLMPFYARVENRLSNWEHIHNEDNLPRAFFLCSWSFEAIKTRFQISYTKGWTKEYSEANYRCNRNKAEYGTGYSSLQRTASSFILNKSSSSSLSFKWNIQPLLINKRYLLLRIVNPVNWVESFNTYTNLVRSLADDSEP